MTKAILFGSIVAGTSSGHLDLNRLDLVLDNSSGAAAKPSPEPYLMALKELGLDASDCVAIEDTANSAAAAMAAGIPVIVSSGDLTADQVVAGAALRVPGLGLDSGEVQPTVLELLQSSTK